VNKVVVSGTHPNLVVTAVCDEPTSHGLLTAAEALGLSVELVVAELLSAYLPTVRDLVFEALAEAERTD
jgi:hypothetical protein